MTVLFTKAFNELGYELEAQRTDWSAANEAGVCLSLWKKETDWRTLVMDTRIHAGPPEDWQHKLGNRKRVAHARRAIAEHDGWIDVVTIDGIPGKGYGDAHPWVPAQRKGKKWRVTFLDEETGHLRLEAQ